MTTSTTQNQHSQTQSRTPSRRDFHIFRLAEIDGLCHKEIAINLNLTRRRVSQIVQNVSHWLSQNPCQDPQLKTELDRKRLAQHIERLRLEDVIHRAHAALTLGDSTLTTTTIRPDGTRTITNREQPFNIQALKTYLRAIQILGKLDHEPEVPTSPPPEGEFPWAKEAMNEVLARWYERIWSRTLKIEHFYNFAEELIGVFVKALGDQQLPASNTLARSASEGNVPPNTTDSDESTVRSGSPDPADLLAAESMFDEDDSDDAIDSERSVGNALCGVPRNEDSAPPRASITSQISQRETPASQVSQQSYTHSDNVSDSPLDTSTPSPPTETGPPTAHNSHENPNRETPFPSLSPSLRPPAS